LNSRIHPVNNNCHVQYRNIQCIGTDEGTAWNNLDFSCEQQVCSNPPLVENADLVFDVEPIVNGEPGFDDGKNTFTTDAHCGKPVFYDCKPGYLASFNVDDSAKANEKMLGTDRPFSLCSDEGTGCYSKVYGQCVAITCPPLTVGENNAWMPFYLKAGQKIYHDAVETLNSEIAAVRDFQNQVSYPQGTQALFECYEDFEAEPKQNMLAISKDLDCDFYAANPTERGINTNNRLSYIRRQTDNNECCRSHDEFDTTSEMVNNLVNRDNVNEGLRWKNVIACFNDKLRRVCQADGTWSDAAYECKCTNNKPVPSTDCEHYMYHMFRNRGLPSTPILIPSIKVTDLENKLEEVAAAGASDSVAIEVTPEQPATETSEAKPTTISISPAITTARTVARENDEAETVETDNVNDAVESAPASASSLSGLFWALVVAFFKVF